MSRKVYSKEFKLEALKLAEEIGVTRAAADLGISQSMVYRWRQAANNEGRDPFRGHGRLTARDEELRKLREEVRRLRQEREILKKATVFFASLHQ